MSSKESLAVDRVDEVRLLIASRTVLAAAGELGVAVATLRRFIRKHGIQLPSRGGLGVLSGAVEAYNSGATITALADEYGVHPTTMRKALLSAGAVIRKEWCRSSAGPLTAGQAEDIVQAYSAGETIPEIATRIGRSAATVHRQLKVHNIPRRGFGPKKGVSRDKRRSQYGITGDNDWVLNAPRCSLCGAPAGSPRNLGRSTLCVDHSHVLGAVRGALCQRCNLGLSYFLDSPALLSKAAQYVAVSPAVPTRPRALPPRLHALLGSMTIDQVVVIDPSHWNVEALVSAGCSVPDIRWSLAAYLQSGGAQGAVFPEEEARYREKHAPHTQALDARKLLVDLAVSDDEAAVLYNTVHLQGAAGGQATHHVGLRRPSGGLVCAMRFVLPRTCRSRHQGLLLQRFATSPGVRVRGGASRLLTAVTRDDPTPVISFSDNRYTDGALYAALGFQCVDHLAPDYVYYRDRQIVNKSRLQKARLLREGGDPAATEYELAAAQGWLRVFDAGKKTWYLPAGACL